MSTTTETKPNGSANPPHNVPAHLAGTTESKEYREIPRDMIVVDDKFNVRERYGDINAFADEIKRMGLLSAVDVIPIKEGKHAGKFKLFAGFRRIKALDILKWTMIPACVKQYDEAGAAAAQTIENMNRKNLTTYEQARAFQRQLEEYGWSAERFSQHISVSAVEGVTGTSKSHIGNVVRALEKLSKPIIEQWKLEHPKLNLHNVIKLAGMDHEEQADYWKELTAEPKDDDGEDGDEEGGDGEGEGGKAKKKDKRRASEAHLTAALVAVKACADTMGKEWVDGAVSSLRFAMGQIQTIPGVYEPKKEAERAKKEKERAKEEAKKEKEEEKKAAAAAKEEEKKAAAAKKEAEKAADKAKKEAEKAKKEAEKLAAAEKSKKEAEKIADAAKKEAEKAAKAAKAAAK